MAIRKSLLTTVNDEQNPQSNILFMNGGGGGAEYTGIDPIVVENDTISIKDNWSAITSINNRIDIVNNNLTNTTNDLTALQSNYVNFVTTITNNVETLSETKADQTDLENLTDTVGTKASQSELDSLSTTVNSKANQSDLNALLDIVGTKADQTDLESLENRVETNENNIDALSATATQFRSDLNDVDESVIQLVSAVDDINVELTNKVAYTDLKYEYNSEEQPVSITGIANLPIEIPGVTKNIYMWDSNISTNPIELNKYSDVDYSKYIPFASADNPDLGITGTPGVISTADKYKLDNIVMFNNNSADMQLTYVGDNSGTSTFLGYSAGTLGFYDLNCPVESAIEDPSIMEDKNNWSEHPFGISPELYDMLRVLSAILSESGEHPYGMIGMTESGTLGWVDLD